MQEFENTQTILTLKAGLTQKDSVNYSFPCLQQTKSLQYANYAVSFFQGPQGPKGQPGPPVSFFTFLSINH